MITAPGPTRVLSPAAAHSAIHRRRWWLLLLAAVAALVLILVLTNQSGTDQHLGPQTTPPHLSNAASTGAQTSARATGSATSTASTATTRTTSGSKAITTPLQAIAAMRTAIAQATNSGNLEPAAATDLNNRLDDITRTISGPANPGPGQGPGKPAGPANDAAHKVADFAHHLGDLANSGQLTPTGQQELADPLAALERLIPATH
jgi:cytoskeletal protein RodZ